MFNIHIQSVDLSELPGIEGEIIDVMPDVFDFSSIWIVTIKPAGIYRVDRVFDRPVVTKLSNRYGDDLENSK